MIEINGKYNTAKVFTGNIEASAHEQISTLCDLQAFANSKIRVMPDVHAGAGCTIGTTMTITDKVCPNHVGVDIGCGLTSYNIGKNLPENFFKELDKFIKRNIPHGKGIYKESNSIFEESFEKRLLQNLSKKCLNFISLERASKSLGTLGSGNHFIEVGRDSEEHYWLTVHSGSRNIGNQVAEFFQKEAMTLCKDDIHNSLKYLSKEELFDEYIEGMKIMQDFASCNRDEMIGKIIKHFGFEKTDDNKIETIHNYIDFSELNNLILRKGAVSAKLNELLLIPLNMRDGIIIAKGKGNEDWNYSAPHGAGRLYSRQQAKAQLNLHEFQSTMDGIYSTCVSESTLDESPMAYKNMKEIIANIEDCVDIIDIIKPVYNFKAS